MTSCRERQTLPSGRYYLAGMAVSFLTFLSYAGFKYNRHHTLQSKRLVRLDFLSILIKSTLRDLLASLSNPILGDWSVIVHMMMLTILRDDSCPTPDPNLEIITKQLWTMLRRYLTNRIACPSEVDCSLDYIQYCLNTLPVMLEQNKQVFTKFV